MAEVTTVEYNGVNLGTVRTLSANQVNEMDASGMDVLFRNYSYTFQFIMALTDPSVTPEETWGPIDLAEDLQGGGWEGAITRAYNRISNLLNMPRRGLIVKRGDQVIIDTTVQRENSKVAPPEDDGNGPFAGEVQIIQPLSNGTWLLQWSVKCRLAQQQETVGGYAEPAVLSIRYDQEQSWDERGYSTITTTGELKSAGQPFRNSEVRQTWATIDSLRDLTLPFLIPGYRRRSRFRVSKDGMTLSFSFVDKQLDTCPPDPAYEAEGDFGVTGSGAVWHGDISVTLRGKKGTPKKKLIEAALAICLSRVSILARDRKQSGLLLWQTMFAKAHGGISVREKLFDNQIAVSMRFLIPPANLVNQTLNDSTINEVIYGAIKSALPGPVSIVAGTIEGAYQVIRAAINVANGDWRAAGRRIRSGGIGYIRSLIGGVPFAGQIANIIWTVVAADEEADKTIAQKGILEAIAQEAASKNPTVTVPQLAIDAFGQPLPGVEQYRENMDAGGLRGNDPNQMVLLVAGFMRDPAVSLSSALTRQSSGVRGPVLGQETQQESAAPIPEMSAIVSSTTKLENVPGAPEGSAGLAPIPTVPSQIPAIQSNSNPFDGFAQVMPGSQIAPTSTGWFVSGAPLSDGMTIEEETEEYVFTSEVSTDVEGWEAGPYSSYNSEIEYLIQGKHLVLEPNKEGEIAKAFQIRAQDKARVVVKVFASRLGSPPVIPFANTTDTDANLVYESGSLSVPQADYNDDGTVEYHVSGVLSYRVLDASKLALRPPVPPWSPVEMSQLVAFIPDKSSVEVTANGA